MAFFDGMQNALFDAVKCVYGDSASWTNPVTSIQHTTLVLLKEPTAERKVIEPDFDPLSPTFEWKQGDLPGLFEVVRSGYQEEININGNLYGILKAKAKYDGKTYIAELQKL